MKLLVLLIVALFHLGCQAFQNNNHSEATANQQTTTKNKPFLNECRDTTLKLKAGCSTPEYPDDVVRFKIDRSRFAYAYMSKNLQVLAWDSTFGIYGISPGTGHLTMIDRAGDTMADITMNIYAPAGWDTLEQKVAEQVAYFSGQCKICSVDFYPSNPVNVKFGSTLINQKVPDFSMTSLNGNNYRSTEKKPEISILFIYSYGCVACRRAIDHVVPDSFAMSRSPVRVHWFCKDGCYLSGDTMFYYTARKDSPEDQEDHPKGVAWAKPSGEVYSSAIALLQKFMVSGYPIAYVVDQNGRIRFTSQGASDNIAADLRRYVNNVNAMDIRIVD